MKNSEQYRSSGTKPNVTISDASIVYEHPDNDDTNGENEYRKSRLTHTMQHKTRRTADINIQHISPIKSYSDIENQFSSTPNHHIDISPVSKIRHSRSPGVESSTDVDNIVLPILKEKRTKFEIPISYEENHGNKQKNNKSSIDANKKQKLIRELAANILELNKLRTQSDKYENQLKLAKSDNKLRSQIQTDLDRLKREMLIKIDGIHELELQLVKIEGNSKYDMNKNGNHTSMKDNNQIMIEIRATLREMIHSQNMVNKTASTSNADGYTLNEMLEEVEKAATRTATSLLSTIVQPHVQISTSPDLQSGTSSSLSSGALSKIDAFKAQLEDQNNALKNKLASLEDKLKNFESSNVNVNEIEQLKDVILRTQRRFEEDKMKLVKEFENERNLTSNNNMMLMKKFKDELEIKINEKDQEMRNYLQTLHSFLPQQQQQQKSQKKQFVYNEQVHQHVRESNVESSFLTEEEEAIARISERIHVLKSKLDSKDNSESRSKNRSEDSDDTDTRELIHLNEQIRQLKSRMIQRNEKLNNIKRMTTHPQGIMKHDKVYLPIQHLNHRYSSEDNLHLVHNPTKSNSAPNQTPQYLIKNPDDTSNSDENNKKHNHYVVIDRSDSQDLSCSPERRYTSSIEIPAEQLENFKASAGKPQSRRSKSASHASSQSNMEVSNLKKHSTKLQSGSNLISVCLKSLKRPDVDKRQDQEELTKNLKEAQKEIEKLKDIIEEKNTLINSHRVSALDKKKHDKEMLYLLQLLETQSKKIIGLKNKIKDLRDNGNWNSDTLSTLSDSLDRVRNDLRDNLETVNGSDIEETFRKIKSNEENKRPRKTNKYKNNITKQNLKGVSESGVQTDDNSGSSSLPSSEKQNVVPNLDETTALQIPLNTLVCNIPEHHELEDLAHQNREQIINLKSLLQQSQDDLIRRQMNNQFDVNVIEKRAEFDALDLAINNRKQILYDLEIRKRRELNSSAMFDDRYVPISEKGVKYLKNEIECLEKTLTKRIKEFREVDKELHEKKHGLMIVKESKKRVEKDVGSLLKLRKFLNAQTVMFDKKADEATKNLIITNDDLKVTQKRKKLLEEDLTKIKKELLTFLEVIKSGSNGRNMNSAILEKLLFMNDATEMQNMKLLKDNMGLITSKHKESQMIEQNIAKQTIELDEISRIVYKQKGTLESLDHEIISKKAEIDTLRDRGLAYTNEFKDKIEQCEEEIVKLKRQKEELNNDLRKLRQTCDEFTIEIKYKTDNLSQKVVEIDQSDKQLHQLEIIKATELNQVNDLEKFIQEKRNLANKIDTDVAKMNRDIEQGKHEEANIKVAIEQLRKSLNDNNLLFTELNENITNARNTLQKLNGEKLDYEVKLNTLNHNCDKLNEEYEKREEQLHELNELNRNKEIMIKKGEEEIGVLEKEKQNLLQETQILKDKLKKKKNDLEKFDQANKTMDARLNETQNELKKTMEKLKHSKQELDALQESMTDVRDKVTELNKEKDTTEKKINEINSTIKIRQEEAEGLKNYLKSTQKQLEIEQKQLTTVHMDNCFEKKTLEAYKSRNKDLTIKIKENEYTSNRFQDLESKLEDREKRIEDLKLKLAEKTSEIKFLKESLNRSQNDLGSLRHEFGDLEETFREREGLLENNLKNVLARLESNQDHMESMREEYDKKIKLLEETIYEKEKLIKNYTPITQQPFDSSLLIYDQNNNTKRNTFKQTTKSKEPDLNSSLNASIYLKDNINKNELNELKQSLNSQLIIEEQRKLKEKLQNSISQKANALEKSKIQRKENFDNLKSKLHDIEVMTTNVSFHGTS